jgi:Domain of unknown function (DUF4115)
MDFTVALILVGVGVVAILAREGYQRARARPTARYLEALRRVHDTAHEEPPAPGDGAGDPGREAPFRPPTAALPPNPSPSPAASSPPVASPPPGAPQPRPGPWLPAGVLRSGAGGRPRPGRILAGGRALVVGVVVVAMLAVSGLAYVLAHHAGSGPARATPPTTLSPSAQKSSSSASTTVAPASPPQPVVVPGAQTSGSAAYTVSSGPVQLALAASTRCWVQLRAVSALGPVVFEGILGPGASRAFENAIGLWIRLGYPPGVVLAVDGRPVGLPASASPIDVTVNTATASTA